MRNALYRWQQGYLELYMKCWWVAEFAIGRHWEHSIECTSVFLALFWRVGQSGMTSAKEVLRCDICCDMRRRCSSITSNFSWSTFMTGISGACSTDSLRCCSFCGQTPTQSHWFNTTITTASTPLIKNMAGIPCYEAQNVPSTTPCQKVLDIHPNENKIIQKMSFSNTQTQNDKHT